MKITCRFRIGVPPYVETGRGTVPNERGVSSIAFFSHVKRDAGQIQSNKTVRGERMNKAHRIAVGMKNLLRRT
jgi:hypothetical protein